MKFSLTNRHVDGGYGVVVVVSTFLIRVILDGITFSYGNLLIELLEEFGQDRASTAIIGSVLHGTLALTGNSVYCMLNVSSTMLSIYRHMAHTRTHARTHMHASTCRIPHPY